MEIYLKPVPSSSSRFSLCFAQAEDQKYVTYKNSFYLKSDFLKVCSRFLEDKYIQEISLSLKQNKPIYIVSNKFEIQDFLKYLTNYLQKNPNEKK